MFESRTFDHILSFKASSSFITRTLPMKRRIARTCWWCQREERESMRENHDPRSYIAVPSKPPHCWNKRISNPGVAFIAGSLRVNQLGLLLLFGVMTKRVFHWKMQCCFGRIFEMGKGLGGKMYIFIYTFIGFLEVQRGLIPCLFLAKFL